MPIYDKPMVYYPLTTLMLANIRDILIITTPHDYDSFKRLFGNGNNLGLKISYKIQPTPAGIAQSFIIAEEFLDGSPAALILGDNIFYGNELVTKLVKANLKGDQATVFAYKVRDPERYGVIDFNENGMALSIEEKPLNPRSNFVVTGLYFYDSSVVKYAKSLIPSERGELEITDLNRIYLEKSNLGVETLGRGIAWLDTGTFDSMNEASIFIQTIEKRQGTKVGSPEEVAWRKGWINDEELKFLAEPLKNSGYGKYLIELTKSST
tara:strand:- start:21 stop:818 length:798 start_codon:yes stop_codon:yes gene_type:complete